MSETVFVNLNELRDEIAAAISRQGLDHQAGIPAVMLASYMVKSLQPLIDFWTTIEALLPEDEDEW